MLSLMNPLTETARTTLHRIPKRGSFDRATADAILDEAFVCHVGFVHEGTPFVIPTTFVRIGEMLYVHGAAASRMLGAVIDRPLCVTVTLLDGLVLARSAFHHSMNYRSVVVLGLGTDVHDPAEKKHILQAMIEKVSPGRSLEARAPNDKETKATRVIALRIDEASVKTREGGPVDDAEDMERACWAGQIPLALRAATPVRDGAPDAHVPVVPRHLGT